MHIPLIAALIAMPAPGADPFCDGLKGIVDGAPGGFNGVPLTLANPLDPATPFTCEINPGTIDESVQVEHPELICEALRPANAERDATLDRDATALDGVIAKCALPNATVTAEKDVVTPSAVIRVGLTFLNDERVTPPVEASGLRITIHARR